MNNHPALETMWNLTGEPRSDWNCFFSPVGLILLDPVSQISGSPFPYNASFFATTGGDFVHFGLLDTGHGYGEHSPVLMTVPCSDRHNIVLGKNLRDFLCLGCHVGYFDLEQLAYNWPQTCRRLDNAGDSATLNSEARKILRLLIKNLNLQPWRYPHGKKLLSLHKEYHHIIKARPYK